MSVFSRFAPRLQEAIVSRLGWTSLRPVQELAGEAILEGKNAVVLAPTAGGKTEASIFPALSSILTRPSDTVAVLYIAPIKALLNNQAERLGHYTEMVGLRRFVWHGDTPASAKKAFNREPVELLMTTPESLEVMLVSPRVPAPKLFADLRCVIIDEVHAIAGTDRGAHLMSVLERLVRLGQNDVQRVGLSATVGNPEAILGWLGGSSQRAGVVIDPPRSAARRLLAVHLQPTMHQIAESAAGQAAGHKSLFFCQSRALTESVAERMACHGTNVFVHHSSISLEERQRAEETFARGGDACIACTSTLELGIDVGDLDLVFQVNTAATVSSFLQRMGRTGRREGQVANTTFFCDNPESVLQAVALIELARAGWVEPVRTHDRCWPVLVHQLLAMALAAGGVTRTAAWEHVGRVPDLRGISREEYEEVLNHLVAEDYLFEAGGLLSMGERAERVYGRRNFMEMYAVFSSPQLYRVFTAAGREVGSLEQDFVDSLVESITSFLLGGRAWIVDQVNHRERTVRVSDAPRGKKPSWGSFVPNLLGFELCQRVRKLLEGEEPYAYLKEAAAWALEGYRHDLGPLLRQARHAIQIEDGTAIWWTFAGGRINHTLRLALARLTGWKVVADNFLLRLDGDSLTQASLGETIARLSQPELWEDQETWTRIIAGLPPYRLSKFQAALPPRHQLEMVGRYLLDLPGARAFLTGAAPESPALDLPALVGAVPAPAATEEIPGAARPQNPIRYITRSDELEALCRELADERVVGLDVETTLLQKDLCVVQLATARYTALIDPLALESLEPLALVLESPSILKIIHNASFERTVLGAIGIDLQNIFDTIEASRSIRGPDCEGGHSLAAVCRRELGISLDKSMQISNWKRRPLNPRQLDYAALDAEVLLGLHRALTKEPAKGS